MDKGRVFFCPTNGSLPAGRVGVGQAVPYFYQNLLVGETRVYRHKPVGSPNSMSPFSPQGGYHHEHRFIQTSPHQVVRLGRDRTDGGDGVGADGFCLPG